ncbi:MAG: MFS transporter [Candidatus Eremiobacteraeota bacterium]|nr:MFS transporter [Candidatus Eremiobacteraeota bacterium]MBV8365724.1 MFS transporter [Candidatus Eremiobacteraeota bacterium]
MARADTTRSIFAERGFTLYFCGQLLSYLGDGLRTLAIPLLVFNITGSGLSLGITYALEFLPFSLFGLVGGSLADRLDRRRLMIACDFVRFAIIGLFALLYWRHALTLPVLYIGIAIVSIAAAIFLGGQSTSIPFLVGTARSGRAVAALLAAEQTSNLVAPPLGGLLFALGGPLPALALNAFTYLTSQISLALVPSMGPDEPGPAPSLHEIWADIVEGFRFMNGDRVMRLVAYCSLLLNFFGMMAAAVFIPFLKLEFHASDAQVGLSYGALAAGSICGSLLGGATAGRWPFGRALLIAYALDGLIFIPVVFAHRLWPAVVFWMLANIGGSFEVTQIISWRMRVTPHEKIGRVFAAVRLIALIGVVPGTLIGGSLADLHGPRLPVIISTFGFLIVALGASAFAMLRADER